MDIEDIKRLNTLWSGVYPHLARQVAAFLPGDARRILEVGPF
jgi:hypothetical protein